MIMFVYKVDDSFDPEKYFNTVPLYQGLFFKRWQERCGQNVVALVANDSENKARVYIQCVEYVLPVVGSVWVAAQGPLGSFSSTVGEEAFYRELCSLCSEISPKTSHIRFQKAPISQLVRAVRAEQAGGVFIQPFAEQVFSLERDFEDVADDFSGSTSRLVRRYEEGKCEGVQFHIEETDFRKYSEDVYSLLKESEKSVPDKKFTLHPYIYYEALFEALNENPECGMLVLGYIKGHKEPVTFVLTVYTGSEAYHLFSGTSSVGYENNMPTLALYTVLKEVKKRDVKRYKIGDTDSVSSDDLSVLQEEFGGEEVKHTVLYDSIVSGWRYYFFRFFRLHWIRAVRHLLMRFYKAVEVELASED